MEAIEARIAEIMNECDCDEDVAECLFYDEIREKYDTDDNDLAESLFLADAYAESDEE